MYRCKVCGFIMSDHIIHTTLCGDCSEWAQNYIVRLAAASAIIRKIEKAIMENFND